MQDGLEGTQTPARTRGFLFADLRDYTGYVETHGDVAGSRWMAQGDYQSPFLLAAAFYVAAVATFWLFFRRPEFLSAPAAPSPSLV